MAKRWIETTVCATYGPALRIRKLSEYIYVLEQKKYRWVKFQEFEKLSDALGFFVSIAKNVEEASRLHEPEVKEKVLAYYEEQYKKDNGLL